MILTEDEILFCRMISFIHENLYEPSNELRNKFIRDFEQYGPKAETTEFGLRLIAHWNDKPCDVTISHDSIEFNGYLLIIPSGEKETNA